MNAYQVSAQDSRHPTRGLYVAADSTGVSVTRDGNLVIEDMTHEEARELVDRITEVLPELEHDSSWPDLLATFPTIRPEDQ